MLISLLKGDINSMSWQPIPINQSIQLIRFRSRATIHIEEKTRGYKNILTVGIYQTNHFAN